MFILVMCLKGLPHCTFVLNPNNCTRTTETKQNAELPRWCLGSDLEPLPAFLNSLSKKAWASHGLERGSPVIVCHEFGKEPPNLTWGQSSTASCNDRDQRPEGFVTFIPQLVSFIIATFTSVFLPIAAF